MRLPRLTTITLGIIAVLCLFLILSPSQERRMPTLNTTNPRLACTCSHEQDHLPPLAPQADLLYRHGRWLERNNLLEQKADVYPQIERYYRIATAHGHYRANLRLRDMIARGLAASDNPVKETVDLVQELIDRGIPGGYYDMGRYLKAGYGVKQDVELGNRYYRKAADLGNPEAQYAVSDMLTSMGPGSYAQQVGYEMLKCAADQGHGVAALEYATHVQNGSDSYPEAVHYLQLATKAGNELAPYNLQLAFEEITNENRESNDLGLKRDDERSRRYKAIWSILADYSYAHPSVPEIDDIVPLPPAPLPPWDGKLKWLEDFKANVPPPQPSEELLTRLAHAKGLDPATGRPDPQAQQALRAKQAADARLTPPSPDAVVLGAICRSGEPCPQSGIWQPLLPGTDAYLRNHQPQYIAQGQPFPLGQMVRQPDGLLQRWRSPTESEAVIQWQLVSYS